MEYHDSVAELRAIAEYARARRMLRAFGTGAIVFGIFALVVGVPGALLVDPINIILVLIGLLLLAEGLWNVILPTAEGVIVDGFMVIIVGLWNISMTVLEIVGGGHPRPFWLILGCVQIGWGIYRFYSYGRTARALREKPSAEALAHMDALIKRIKKAKTSESPDIIGFQTKSFNNAQNWKGQLGDRVALFIDKRGHDIVVATRDEVDIRENGKVLIGKALKASIRLGDQRWEGLINPDSFAKYQRWKAVEVVESPKDERESEADEY